MHRHVSAIAGVQLQAFWLGAGLSSPNLTCVERRGSTQALSTPAVQQQMAADSSCTAAMRRRPQCSMQGRLAMHNAGGNRQSMLVVDSALRSRRVLRCSTARFDSTGSRVLFQKLVLTAGGSGARSGSASPPPRRLPPTCGAGGGGGGGAACSAQLAWQWAGVACKEPAC
jgi:hypothetical protein